MPHRLPPTSSRLVSSHLDKRKGPCTPFFSFFPGPFHFKTIINSIWSGRLPFFLCFVAVPGLEKGAPAWAGCDGTDRHATYASDLASLLRIDCISLSFSVSLPLHLSAWSCLVWSTVREGNFTKRQDPGQKNIANPLGSFNRRCLRKDQRTRYYLPSAFFSSLVVLFNFSPFHQACSPVGIKSNQNEPWAAKVRIQKYKCKG